MRCSVLNCDRDVFRATGKHAGLCNAHRARVIRTGSTQPDKPLRGPGGYQPFWSRVAVAGPNDCWMWIDGADDPAGFGITTVNGEPVRVHRRAWELENLMPVPEGMGVVHRCKHRLCCNPAHQMLYGGRDD